MLLHHKVLSTYAQRANSKLHSCCERRRLPFRCTIPDDLRELIQQCLLFLLPLRPQSLLAIETDEHDSLLRSVHVKAPAARRPPAFLAADGEERRIADEGVQVAMRAFRQGRQITYAQSTEGQLVVL